ncbi:carbohydrate-binding module family 13 protein [Rhizoctonia solani AG-3 Rhs1AP]|uniref:Carbohydrate-binding module family 13 protein n=2 Tax=Rhizoctonia solani AG-3 TaxID=1086053 RepID=A0A074SNF6_9AGAM|nr:carbohydrate-binding module family 13 protein [Rhizoctonia solani AG-3 Rhs1AP]KEP51582.1 carbohydrate-binding module family 13 protein [Rhizoctonia solani 123E]
MGQKPSHHTPDQDILLGTYFIIHDCSGKAIQIDSQNYHKITVWDRHAGDNQQWYLQQSGKGYMFKNKQHGYYLGLSLADDSPFPVCASPYPTSWVVMKQDPQAIGEGCARIVSCDEIKSRVLSLDSGVLSIGENGDKVRATRFYASADESWRLERLSDDTGEELPMQYQIERAQLQQDLAGKVAELSKKDRKLSRRVEDLAKKDADIIRLRADLDVKDRGIRSRDQELMTKNQELARKEQELAMKDRELLAKIQEIAELKTLRPKPSIIRRLLQEAELRSKGSRSNSRNSSRASSVAPPVSVTYGSEFDFRSQDIELQSQYSEEDEEVLDGEVANLYARAERLETILSEKGDGSETGSHYEY